MSDLGGIQYNPPLLQENYFGEYDMYTDFEEVVSSPVLSTSTSSGLGWSPLGVDDSERKDASDLHPLDLRPWDITVYINLYKVHGRLPMVNMTATSKENDGYSKDIAEHFYVCSFNNKFVYWQDALMNYVVCFFSAWKDFFLM